MGSFYSIFQIGQYLLTYPRYMESETFFDEWYYGIIFFVEDFKYEVIHNYAMDTERLFISQRPKYSGLYHQCYFLNNDIPFKPATFDFLPTGVTAKELNNESKI
jgi:hypothetical protein